MDTRSLVSVDDIQLGQQVLDALSADAALRVHAVLWWFDETQQQWLYAVSTPVSEERGLQAAYLRIRKALESHDLLSRLPLDRVWVIDDRHPVLDLVRATFGEPQNSSYVSCVVNGTLLPDLYIYKIEKRRSRPRKRSKS